jgi:TonB family protein
VLQPALRPAFVPARMRGREFDLWHDVFVHQSLPWRRFLQSAFLHAAAAGLIWAVSLSWIQERRILDRSEFDRASLVTYTPAEYLPPLDTGESKAPKMQKADPVYARQPILSVPREADNPSQTIVVPPDLKLDRDVALPNIIATSAILPAVPLDAAPARLSRTAAPDVPGLQVVAPAPEVSSASNRVQAGMKSDVIAPPPEVTQSTKGRAGLMNIGPSNVVAPAPQLTLAEQHSQAGGGGRLTGGGVQPVAPPPSVAASNTRGGGRLIALGIHPVAPTGPVAVPAGNRRGTFAANPQGKSGASGTPGSTGTKADGGFNAHKSGSLPSGLHVGDPNSADDAIETASLSSGGANPRARSNAPVASPVSEDKITDLDRSVFHGKRVYGRTLNMPNLNSATGSWVIKFAELGGEHKDGELLEPVATEKPDPGYPLELMRANVHGMVTLYAVIHSDGKVGEIRVLNSPDDRLDAYAAKALAGWKFVPAERAGKPVALEAVVMIPFKVRQSF